MLLRHLLISAEIEAQPDNEKFLLGVQKSAFFKQLFESGFTNGILWAKKHENTKFVSESVSEPVSAPVIEA